MGGDGGRVQLREALGQGFRQPDGEDLAPGDIPAGLAVEAELQLAVLHGVEEAAVLGELHLGILLQEDAVPVPGLDGDIAAGPGEVQPGDAVRRDGVLGVVGEVQGRAGGGAGGVPGGLLEDGELPGAAGLAVCVVHQQHGGGQQHEHQHHAQTDPEPHMVPPQGTAGGHILPQDPVDDGLRRVHGGHGVGLIQALVQAVTEHLLIVVQLAPALLLGEGTEATGQLLQVFTLCHLQHSLE